MTLSALSKIRTLDPETLQALQQLLYTLFAENFKANGT